MLNRFFVSIMVLFLSSLSIYADRLEDIKEKGVLKVGVKYDFKPFGFIDEKNEIAGFDIDLLKYIADDLDVDIEFVQVTSKTRIPMVEKGQIDLAGASMTHKIERDKKIDFSISYFFDGQSFLVRKGIKVKETKDLAKVKVGAIQGATSGANFKKLYPKSKVLYFQEYTQALVALKKGKIDAITTDLVWCSTQAKESNGELKVAGGVISVEPYGIGVKENESNLRDAVNFAIQNSVKDGTYLKIYKKWFAQKPKKLPELWP